MGGLRTSLFLIIGNRRWNEKWKIQKNKVFWGAFWVNNLKVGWRLPIGYVVQMITVLVTSHKAYFWVEIWIPTRPGNWGNLCLWCRWLSRNHGFHGHAWLGDACPTPWIDDLFLSRTFPFLWFLGLFGRSYLTTCENMLTWKVTVCCALIFQKGLPHLQVLCYKSKYHPPPSRCAQGIVSYRSIHNNAFPNTHIYHHLGDIVCDPVKKWVLNGCPFTP